MAVKARAEITLSSIRDVQSVTRYYLLQSSTSAAPSKPTTNPPGGNWVITEPTYTTGSTNSLYFVDLTVFSDDSFVYSEVSLSSSYEAAKVAYNKAENAETIAEKATHSINLIPFGSRSFDDTDYWVNGFAADGFIGAYGTVWNTEQLEDGWIHVLIDNTEQTGSAAYVGDSVLVATCPSVKPGKLYTILYEIRNNKSVLTGANTYFYIIQRDSKQFWGGAYEELIEGTGTTSTFNLAQMAPDQNVVYRKRFTKYADDGEHAGSNPSALFEIPFRTGKGDYADYEVRISLYEGRYLGDYMPYVVSDTTDLSTAITASQATADSKNTVYYQASAPSGGTYKTNDIWFDTNDGNKMYMYNGTTWVAEQFGNAAISDLSITNAKIADGTIENAKISNLDAGKITTGTMSASRIKGDTLTLGGENNVDGVMEVYDADGNLVGSFTREGLMAIAGTIGGWTIKSNRLTADWDGGSQRHYSAIFSPAEGLRFQTLTPRPDDSGLNYGHSVDYGLNQLSFGFLDVHGNQYGAVAFLGVDVDNADKYLGINPNLRVEDRLQANRLELCENLMTGYVRQPAMIMSGVKTVNQTGTSTKSLTLCTIPEEYQTGYRVVPFVSRRYGSASGVLSDDGDFYYAYYNSVSHDVCIKLANKLPTGVIYQFDYMIYVVPET